LTNQCGRSGSALEIHLRNEIGKLRVTQPSEIEKCPSLLDYY